MLPTTLALYIATQVTLAQPVKPSCDSGSQWNASQKACEIVEKDCGTRFGWDRRLQSCQLLPPTREQCWSDGQQLDSATRTCVPVQLSAFCREHNWDYEQEHTVSRILNDLGAHDCEEAEALIAKTRKLSLHSAGFLKIQDLRPLRALPFIEELNLDGQRINDLMPLQKLTRLKKLSLRNNEIFDLSPLLTLSRLESLDLSGNLINPNDSSLKALQRKMKVALKFNQATGAGEAADGSGITMDDE